MKKNGMNFCMLQISIRLGIKGIMDLSTQMDLSTKYISGKVSSVPTFITAYSIRLLGDLSGHLLRGRPIFKSSGLLDHEGLVTEFDFHRGRTETTGFAVNLHRNRLSSSEVNL